ncbi:MAG: glutaminase A [Actinomycetota bacterium]|nr:glutaminase A [Actinomycetota bacterium]
MTSSPSNEDGDTAIFEPEDIDRFVAEAHELHRENSDGEIADHTEVLAGVDPDTFGISVAGVDGGVHDAGDSDQPFSIQSVSKVFVYALVCGALGHDVVHERVGVNNTGLSFDSVMAVELSDGHPMNPMVNAGALATTGSIQGDSKAEKWSFIEDGLSRFAGRQLKIDSATYEADSGAPNRNGAIARLIESYGRLDSDPDEVVDLFIRQCSLEVTVHDLAVMGATLAGGGVNPITGDQAVEPSVCRDTLAVMAGSGMYEGSGEWLFQIGMPGKSGVSGGILTVAPGNCGIATFSPRLDDAGNSVRGKQATAFLSEKLRLNIFAS